MKSTTSHMFKNLKTKTTTTIAVLMTLVSAQMVEVNESNASSVSPAKLVFFRTLEGESKHKSLMCYISVVGNIYFVKDMLPSHSIFGYQIVENIKTVGGDYGYTVSFPDGRKITMKHKCMFVNPFE